MISGEHRYIWESGDWPNWRHDLTSLAGPLADASRCLGLLLGRLTDVGVALRDQASLRALTEDVVKTSEIEGEILNVVSVRSSIARRLGVDIGALAPVDRHVEGVVDMMLDATACAASPLSVERLHGWHAALFPTGFSGMSKIAVGQWRSDADGPMQVVSGPVGRRKVHFEAPPAETLPEQMEQFLDWANADTGEPALIKAGLAHLWFVTVHPYDDGNGRIARAIGDLFLARADGNAQRFYSLSAQIQKGTLDVTRWLAWFLGALARAVNSTHGTLDAVLNKARFWQDWAGIPLNERQVKVLNRALDGLEGKLTSSKWASLAKCSPDTALRDITQLLDLGVLARTAGGGRSTSYELVRH